jgi:hypothetical protein
LSAHSGVNTVVHRLSLFLLDDLLLLVLDQKVSLLANRSIQETGVILLHVAEISIADNLAIGFILLGQEHIIVFHGAWNLKGVQGI